jgi:hypothetical protein
MTKPKKKKKARRSGFGAIPDLPPFTEQDEAEFHEL